MAALKFHTLVQCCVSLGEVTDFDNFIAWGCEARVYGMRSLSGWIIPQLVVRAGGEVCDECVWHHTFHCESSGCSLQMRRDDYSKVAISENLSNEVIFQTLDLAKSFLSLKMKVRWGLDFPSALCYFMWYIFRGANNLEKSLSLW